MTESTRTSIRRGVVMALPVALGFLPLAFILGVQGSQHGLSALGMAMMCGLNLAGGSEFAAVSLWSATPPLLLIALTTWLINSRHIVMGAALTPYVQKAGLSNQTALTIFFLMCDETWALAMNEIDRRKQAGIAVDRLLCPTFYFSLALTLWLVWWMGAAVGALVGQSVGDMTQYGFMMAFPATFIALLAMMSHGIKQWSPVIVAGVVSAIASLIFPGHYAVMLAIAASLLWVYVQGDKR